MGTLRPFLLSEDARSQAAFYAESLGGEILSVITYGQAAGAEGELKDKVMHLCVTVAEGSSIFMADAVEPFTQGSGFLLDVSYKTKSEAESAFAKLSSAPGGQVKQPFARQPYGLYYGELVDPYGVSWMITSDDAS
ncbi:VOC family protein [Paenibacillus sp. VCA1]|uniref:VOC family protein n=1 Tax=Paenibacillus sp. VCA1 TaxID=3039148 RepID=UPI0028710ECA|nr:VOC family protein [Paenibacillus sp. VCA1]MDR9856366.1 VOC family protein [Paenibacillus sp. VCA1]